VTGSFPRCSFTMNEKTELRKQFLALRNGIDPHKRKADSEVICQKALSLMKDEGVRAVFVYLSAGSEVETHALIQELCRQSVTVAVPACDTTTHTMDAVRYCEDLIPDSYGILTPRHKEVILPSAIDLILVPALAFDKEGYRLGYGGGYYDRYLKNFTKASVGLCFSACMTESLPHEAHDCAVSRVLTEER